MRPAAGAAAQVCGEQRLNRSSRSASSRAAAKRWATLAFLALRPCQNAAAAVGAATGRQPSPSGGLWAVVGGTSKGPASAAWPERPSAPSMGTALRLLPRSRRGRPASESRKYCRLAPGSTGTSVSRGQCAGTLKLRNPTVLRFRSHRGCRTRRFYDSGASEAAEPGCFTIEEPAKLPNPAVVRLRCRKSSRIRDDVFLGMFFWSEFRYARFVFKSCFLHVCFVFDGSKQVKNNKNT